MPKHFNLKVGYLKASELVYRLFTVTVSTLLLLAASPVMICIALVIYIQDRGPILYAGTRLGKNKAPFTMYKFRTLRPDADRLIGAELFTYQLSSNRELLTRSGRFLRETRLDELPQIFNTLKGDMDLLGPRPVRPEIYEKLCRNIKGYDRRFTVKPGLIGFSQLVTPHSTPKKIRNFLDRAFLKMRHSYLRETALIIVTLSALALRMIHKLLVLFYSSLHNFLAGKKEHRSFERSYPREAQVSISAPPTETGTRLEPIRGALRDINEEALAVSTAEAVPDGELAVEIRFVVHRRRLFGKDRVSKTARCRGEIYHPRGAGDRGSFDTVVIKYTPVSPFNAYLIHQYLLRSSLIYFCLW